MLMPREMGSASLTGVNQWMAVMAEHMAQVCHNADIYIMMKCLFVMKNDHFLLRVSCNHRPP